MLAQKVQMSWPDVWRTEMTEDADGKLVWGWCRERLLHHVASAIDSTFNHEMKAQREAAHHRRPGWLWSASAAFVLHFPFSCQAQRRLRVSTHHMLCLPQTRKSYQQVSTQPFNFPSQWLWQIVCAPISFCSKQNKFRKKKKTWHKEIC